MNQGSVITCRAPTTARETTDTLAATDGAHVFVVVVVVFKKKGSLQRDLVILLLPFTGPGSTSDLINGTGQYACPFISTW